MPDPRFEVCVDSLTGALAAEVGGAHRVELCANLLEGGTTPSAGTVRLVRERCRLDLFVMIRPRGGDFLYTADEIDTMRADIEAARAAGVDGVVFGLLRPDASIDEGRTTELVELASPLPVTFHRAFDHTPDPTTALEAVIAAGCRRLLTSGGAASAPDGAAELRALNEQAGDRLTIVPGGGVRRENVAALLQLTGCREVHFSGRTPVESGMRYRRESVPLAASSPPSDHHWAATTSAEVAAIVSAARQDRTD